MTGFFTSVGHSKWRTLDTVLNDTHRLRPKTKFDVSHPDYNTHHQIICSPLLQKIPTPSGVNIPRRDHQDVYAQYCRVMLLLFKPWSHATDLRADGQSWINVFQEFCEVCGPHIISIMDNMQILHECRDSRDDHFAQ
ncbi:hypothetical protein F5146DRAFT_938369 [Armillaria mellea]|nr:hypothetical protein F5146DRAFT_938369 [Armillaria mellea]